MNGAVHNSLGNEAASVSAPYVAPATERTVTSVRVQSVVVAVALLILVVAIQSLSGAYTAEFGGQPDEPAHYISGLMVRDYIASGFREAPVRYAENYYSHYPRVAIGHWPPVFYMLEAAWMLAGGPSRISIMLFIGTIAVLLGFAVYAAAREISVPGAIAGAVLLLLSPPFYAAMGMVMSDMLVTLLCFVATWAFGRYLETEQDGYCYLFATFSSLAIMTKGNALALALMAPLALIITRKFGVLWNRSVWIGVAMIGLICGPWYYYWRTASGFADRPGIEYVLRAAPFFTWQTVLLFGPVLSVFAALGLWDRVIRPLMKNEPVRPYWAVQVALILAVLAFQSVIAIGLDGRYVMTAAPAVILFMLAGIEFLAERTAVPAPIYTGLVVIIFLFTQLTAFRQQPLGFGEAAQMIVSNSAFSDAKILTASFGSGEGMFTCELARREHRPGHIVLRSTKVLSRNGWDGSYTPYFKSAAEVQSYLNDARVKLVVVDRWTPPRAGVVDILSDTIQAYPQHWRLAAAYPSHAAGSGRVEVFVRNP